MSMLPRIGVTPDDGFTTAGTGRPARARYELKKAYTEAVLKAGGVPLVLPYTRDESVIDAYLEAIDGLLVTGGVADVDPALYGEAPRPGLGEVKAERGAFEHRLVTRAIQLGKPVLGVCGGMQLLNVVCGGTLVQDIRRERPDSLDHEQKHDPALAEHAVRVQAGSRLESILGASTTAVNSTHHQVVNRVGEGLAAVAFAEDGLVEAIESTSGLWRLGVQWHPELQAGEASRRIYSAFVEAAKRC